MIIDSLIAVTGRPPAEVCNWVIGLSVSAFILSMGVMVYLSKRD